MNIISNGESVALDINNNQLQVLVSGKFGDGYITKPKTCKIKAMYGTNCKYKEYIDYKTMLLGDLVSRIGYTEKNGYSQTPICTVQTHCNKDIETIRQLAIEDSLNCLDSLGIALWFYDDGSLHRKNLFYNLNTQAFSKEVNRDIFIPFFEKLGTHPTLGHETKKDGKEFWYLRFGKLLGANIISEILDTYRVECYSYKIWSSETMQEFAKFQEKLKATGLDFYNMSSQARAALYKRLTKI